MTRSSPGANKSSDTSCAYCGRGHGQPRSKLLHGFRKSSAFVFSELGRAFSVIVCRYFETVGAFNKVGDTYR